MSTIHDPMTSKKTGLALACVASFFAFACGGDSSSPDDAGNAGSENVGGATATGGSGGSNIGGTSTGGASGGSGGSTAVLEPFACLGEMPKSASITNFDEVMSDGLWGDSTTGLAGGTFEYGSTEPYAFVDGALHVAGSVSGYSGVGIYMNNCVDASMYKGIRFSIGGDAGGMDMTFQLQTNSDYPIAIDPATEGNKGACQHDPADLNDNFAVCASPQKTFAVPAEGSVVVAFEELMGGKPVATANPAEILGLQWQFAWSDTATAYDVDVTIDNVEFVETLE